MSLRSRVRREHWRAIKHAAGANLAAALDGLGQLDDAELARLRCTVKLDADLGCELAALDAVRRLRPRDKLGKFRWFPPPGTTQTIRILDEETPVTHEHRIAAEDRFADWIREGGAHVSVGAAVTRSRTPNR